MRHPPQVVPLDGDHRAERAAPVGDRLLDPAQVAEPLLAGVGAEQEVARRLQAGLVKDAREGDQGGDGEAVVADAGAAEPAVPLAHGQVGAAGEDGVGVRGEEERAAASRPGAAGDDVAGRVPLRREAELREAVADERGALGLLERRRGDLGDAAGQLDDRGDAPLGGGERGAHRRTIPAVVAVPLAHPGLPAAQ